MNVNIIKSNVKPEKGKEYYITDKSTYQFNKIGKVTKIKDGKAHVVFSNTWSEDTKKPVGFKTSSGKKVLDISDYEFYKYTPNGGKTRRVKKTKYRRRTIRNGRSA